jgi:hypothetical protein
MITNRLTRHFATAAATTIAATPAHAAVVDWGNANLVIPATYAGLYINVEARTTGSDEALGGWDINPYGAGSLSWYAPIGGGILHMEDSVGPSNPARRASQRARRDGCHRLVALRVDSPHGAEPRTEASDRAYGPIAVDPSSYSEPRSFSDAIAGLLVGALKTD